MRLVCLHADTVDALSRLSITFNDLTPGGLWGSQHHLISLTPEQMEALDIFRVEFEDVTPAQMAQAAGPGAQASARRGTGEDARSATQSAMGAEPDRADTRSSAETRPAAPADQPGRDQPRASAAEEAEVPLAQARDAGVFADETIEGKSEGRSAAAPPVTKLTAPASGAAAALGHKSSGGKPPAPSATAQPAQGGRKGQPSGAGQAAGQRYGTTRLRISVAGKYTEATVANGKIVVAGRTFDSPDQAAAELTKSRGDWTFWEYYDSADGKWRMLTRDWDTVLKSAAPGGR